jgi:hypothetical protein
MMIRQKFLIQVPLFVLGVLLVSAAPAQTKATARKVTATTETRPDLEPKAVELLKAMSSRLAAAHTMAFTAVESFESPSRQGHPVVYGTKTELILQRPDKLRVISSADGPPSEFYYDGKIMMAFAPAENLVAIAEAPPTIDAALKAAYESAAIYFPYTDLIVADPYGDAAPGMQLAYYIGKSQLVGDTTTDIVAFVGDGVFAQIWLGAEDKLPRLIHAVYLDDPLQLRHNLIFSNWQLDPAVPPETFGSANAQSAKRIPFSHPNPAPSPGARPTTKGKPPKSQ